MLNLMSTVCWPPYKTGCYLNQERGTRNGCIAVIHIRIQVKTLFIKSWPTGHAIYSDVRVERARAQNWCSGPSSSAILNSYGDYRCKPVSRPIFPVPRFPFHVSRSSFHILRVPFSPLSALRPPPSALRSPLSALPSPLSALPSPLSPLRSPLSALRSPLSPLRSPLSALPSPLSPLPSPLSPLRSPLSALRSPLSALPSPLSPLPSPLSPACLVSSAIFQVSLIRGPHFKILCFYLRSVLRVLHEYKIQINVKL